MKNSLVNLEENELYTRAGDGSAANMLGLGIASAIAGSYLGAVGMALCYYNYYKD